MVASGEQYVMIYGILMMLKLSAVNLGYHHHVRNSL